MQFGILWPVFMLVALVFVVWATLVVQRMAHLKRVPPGRETFASGESALRYFQPVEMPANNLANLFEMPVLFFALVPLLLAFHQANAVQVLLAWAYVLARIAHSWFHIVARRVKPRFFSYLASVAVLAAMWVGFFLDMVSAARTYAAAMG